jgi:hypothetical protein
MVLFLTALVLIITIDTLIQKLAERFNLKSLLSQD